MKKYYFIPVVFLFIATIFSSCEKEDNLEGTRNEFNVVNPMAFFKEDNNTYLIYGGKLIVGDRKGNEVELTETYSSGGIISEWFSWDYNYRNFEPESKLDLIFEFKYKLSANGNEETMRYNKEIEITPNAKYAWDPYQNKLDIIGYFEANNSDDESELSGKWRRSDGASSYIKISNSNIYLCNGSLLQEFSGTINGNNAILTEGGTTLEFYVSPVGDDILVEQYISNQHVGSMMYYTTADYPCN